MLTVLCDKLPIPYESKAVSPLFFFKVATSRGPWPRHGNVRKNNPTAHTPSSRRALNYSYRHCNEHQNTPAIENSTWEHLANKVSAHIYIQQGTSNKTLLHLTRLTHNMLQTWHQAPSSHQPASSAQLPCQQTTDQGKVVGN